MTDEEIVNYHTRWLYKRWKKMTTEEEVAQNVWMALFHCKPKRDPKRTELEFRGMVGVTANRIIMDEMSHERVRRDRERQMDTLEIPVYSNYDCEGSHLAEEVLAELRPSARSAVLAKRRGLTNLEAARSMCRSQREVEELLAEAACVAAVYGLSPKVRC